MLPPPPDDDDESAFASEYFRLKGNSNGIRELSGSLYWGSFDGEIGERFVYQQFFRHIAEATSDFQDDESGI